MKRCPAKPCQRFLFECVCPVSWLVGSWFGGVALRATLALWAMLPGLLEWLSGPYQWLFDHLVY